MPNAAYLGVRLIGTRMEIGTVYDVVYRRGKYEIEYENGVKCIKKTPKSYRVERPDGSTILIRQDSIIELKKVSSLENTKT
ncbi:hypothetical protein [Thiosocius teredinicola]|uniref:hypothetical protein n=1 Tax=Thiosocius teredinicola TaxID=1973002 RepID=UPI002FE4A526